MAYSSIELELLKNTLESIVDEMALTVVRTAYSTTLKNAMDFSTGLCDAEGNLVAQGLCIPMHLGSLPDGLAAVLNRYRGQITDGDLFLLNDPYEGGAHLPDLYLYKPIFIEGDLIGFTAVIAHHTDIGGRVAGGNACDSTEIYQEGLRIPPLKLYEAGRPVQALFDLVERNVRVPHRVLGDLRAQLAACHIGEREVRKLAGRHGKGRLRSGFIQLLDYAERLTRASIAGFPDGAYRTPFNFLEFLLGCWGGRPDRDGIDGCASVVVNFSNNPAEVVEAEYPLQILRYGFLPDTGGPGRHRGGLAIVREYRFTEEEGALQIRSDRHRSRPYGLAGGTWRPAGARPGEGPGGCPG